MQMGYYDTIYLDLESKVVLFEFKFSIAFNSYLTHRYKWKNENIMKEWLMIQA